MRIVELEKPNLSKVKMNCDYVIHNKLMDYPMVADAWSSHNFTIFAGRMGSGKTSLAISLLKSVFKKCFHKIYVFIPENSRSSIENDILGKNLPDNQLFSELTFENLTQLYEDLKANSADGKSSLLIIDDFQTQLKNPEIVSILEKIIIKMRHLRTTTWLLQQNFQKLVKPLREVVSNVVCFNLGKSQMTKIFDEAIEMKKDNYDDLIKLVFVEKHDWILVNLHNSRKIYRMFDEVEI